MKRSAGFTVIELVAVIIFLGFATLLLLYQKNNIQASQRDEARKTAINAMYYNLEEVFYSKHSYYPVSISSENLPAMDPVLFTDPTGYELGDPQSDYRYDGIDCENDRCKSYKLIGHLEKEADYIKTNRN